MHVYNSLESTKRIFLQGEEYISISKFSEAQWKRSFKFGGLQPSLHWSFCNSSRSKVASELLRSACVYLHRIVARDFQRQYLILRKKRAPTQAAAQIADEQHTVTMFSFSFNSN